MPAVSRPSLEDVTNDYLDIFNCVIREFILPSIDPLQGDVSVVEEVYPGLLPQNLAERFHQDGIQSLERAYAWAYEGKGGVPADLIPKISVLWHISVALEDLGGSLAKSKWKALNHLVLTAEARMSLDPPPKALGDPEPLTVSEIALLGDIDERSVRNAISRKELTTMQDHRGKVIPNSAAREWLKLRRNFVATSYSVLSDTSIDGVDSPAAFGAYLAEKRLDYLDGEDIEKFLSTLPSGVLEVEEILALENGVFSMSLDCCASLANLYKEPESVFLTKVMELFFPGQLAALTKIIVEKNA